MNLEIIDQTAQRFIKEHRGTITTDHDFGHFSRVARATTEVCTVAGFSSRETALARIGGWLHDSQRSPNEENRQSDVTESAKAAEEFMKELSKEKTYFTSETEQESVKYAILNCSWPPQFFHDRPDPKQWTLSEKILAALFTADKIEQNGVWIIARRSHFVAGVRLHGKENDLQKYDLIPGRDENKAVLLEGALRIAFVNPEGIYPPVFKPLTAKMYGSQRDFMHGLLAAEGMNIDDYAAFLDSTHYLLTRKIDLNRNELAEKLRTAGGLSDQGIAQADGDLTSSAVEAVAYFSSHYKEPLEELVPEWKPKNAAAKKWQSAMIDYLKIT